MPQFRVIGDRPVTRPASDHTVTDWLRSYRFHGLRLEEGVGARGGAIGDCPFCAKEGKFSVESSTGRWRCWVCGEGSEKGGGNLYTFLRSLWRQSCEATKDNRDLLLNRGLLFPDTLD